MQESFTESQEEDMLDHLYTLQYQFRGILAISLGRVATPNSACCTHGLFMRFPSKELLLQYMDHPARLKVAEEFIIPYYEGLIVADFESFVKSDIEPLFRRGEEYESGIEYVLLFEAKKDINSATIEGVINVLAHLQHELGQLVVQLTAGRNFSPRNQGYTHGLVARIPSGKALHDFKSHPAYISILAEKILPISNKMLSVHFHVDSVGTTIAQ
ncbi:hypothetical protein O6H91_16G022700 [Diphasiastrum complanatum]|nr:hypothetical protein O6H91_16G022700 [Diphasiastrum complanatum]